MQGTWATLMAALMQRPTSSEPLSHTAHHSSWDVALITRSKSSMHACTLQPWRPEGACAMRRVEVASPAFEGKTRLQCHRLVYDILDEELKGGVHALSVKTKAA